LTAGIRQSRRLVTQDDAVAKDALAAYGLVVDDRVGPHRKGLAGGEECFGLASEQRNKYHDVQPRSGDAGGAPMEIHAGKYLSSHGWTTYWVLVPSRKGSRVFGRAHGSSATRARNAYFLTVQNPSAS